MYPLLKILSEAIPPSDFAALDAWTSTFYPFQRDWLLEPARFAICNKARQIGISHSTAGWAVIRGAFLGETTTVISIGEREAFEVLETATKHARVLERLGSTWARGRPKGDRFLFDNGGRIIALPASSGGRSFAGNVILDEFAYHEGRADRVWDGAAAVVTHGYAMRVVSTPNGVGNLFHELWTNPAAARGYARHEIPIRAAIEQGFPVDLEACWRMSHGDKRVFAQLFECSFLDGAEQYIPTSMVEAAVSEDTGKCHGDTYAGLDVGLVNDLSSLVVVKQDAYTNRAHIVARKDWKRTDWDEQQKGIEKSRDEWGWRKLCVDSTGLGSVPAHLLQQKFGKHCVEPVVFTRSSKEELATTLYQAFADRMVAMRRDVDLMNDLCAIRRIVTLDGAVRYDADRTARGHADRAWALALALYACRNKPARRNEGGAAIQ